LLGAVLVSDAAVVTSGDYVRCYVDSDGRRRHHLLDPTTGYPAESGVVSVTIVAPTSTEADALATIVFVAGIDRGLSLLRKTPDVEAILVGADLCLHVTAGLADRFLATNPASIAFI
jgi:thiamine biosynthesis lipoprotein